MSNRDARDEALYGPHKLPWKPADIYTPGEEFPAPAKSFEELLREQAEAQRKVAKSAREALDVIRKAIAFDRGWRADVERILKEAEEKK